MRILGITVIKPKLPPATCRVLKYFEEHKGSTISQCAAALELSHRSIYYQLKRAGTTVKGVQATSEQGKRNDTVVKKPESKPKQVEEPLGFDRKPLWRACEKRKRIPKLSEMRKLKETRKKLVILPEGTR